MSEETQSTVSEEVPPAPVPQEPQPQEAEKESVTLKTPPHLLGATESPQSDSEPLAGEGADEETREGSQDVQDPQEAEEPSGPVVETTPTGQTVTFSDGRVVYTRSSDAPVSNSEWREYERTHQGESLRYPFVPGDREYTPYSDPNVPNSHAAQQIEREIASYAERVSQDPETQVSYMWNALHGVHEGELDRAIASGGGSDKVMA